MEIPRNWFDCQSENESLFRSSTFRNERATATERYSLKELLGAVMLRLSDVEEKMRVLEDQKEDSLSGSLRTEITSSLETLLFWLRMLERKLAVYSSKAAVETEFGPRVRIIKRRIRVLMRKSNL